MALLPPFFLDTVVAIGVGDDPLKRSWIGTGFLYGRNLNPEEIIPENKRYSVWLVTNKHVLDRQARIYIKFNSANDPASKDYPIDLTINGRNLNIGHPNPRIDVSVISLDANFIKTEGRIFQFIQSDAHSKVKANLKAEMATEGDRVFVLGFPMGLVAPERQYVICRGGYLARIRDFLDDRTTDYLVDATVFPGNSGGPVFSCPSALAIAGTPTNPSSNLIGIVKSYIPYQDVAVSAQTGRPRVTFEENTGLTAIESVDSIRETIELAMVTLSTP